MNTRRGGLGRGLGALIPTAPVAPSPTSAPASAAQVTAAGSPEGGVAGQPRPAATSTADMVPVPGARFAELAVSDIRPNPKQPRQVFDEVALAELAHSLREVGFLQPVVVR